MKSALTMIALMTLAVAATGQSDRFAVTESYDPMSPELVTYEAGDIVTVMSTRFPGGLSSPLLWARGALGLASTSNVDAFSDLYDVFPGTITSTSGCRQTVLFEYTVTRAAAGEPGSPVEMEALGNGAASDTFGVVIVDGSPGPPYLATDALGVTPGPFQTDLDALAWAERGEFYPVVFSLDSATAGLNGFTPADLIMVSSAFGAPTLFRSEADLGLMPGDDVDAIAVNKAGAVVFSLTDGSPSLAAFGVTSGTMLVSSPGSGSFGVWSTPDIIGLRPDDDDDVNGVRISDPAHIPTGNGNIQSLVVPGQTIDTIFIDNTNGSSHRRVDVFIGEMFQFQFNGPDIFTEYVIFVEPGIPCGGPVPTIAGNMNFIPCAAGGPGITFASSPIFSGLVGPCAPLFVGGTGNFTFPGVFGLPLDFTFQGIEFSPPFNQFRVTNVITLRFEP